MAVAKDCPAVETTTHADWCGVKGFSASLVLAVTLVVPRETWATELPAEVDPNSVVKPFMLALMSNDVVALRSLTSLPFTFDSTAAGKKCRGVFKTTDEVSAWLKCVRKAEDRIFSQMKTGADVLERIRGSGESEPPKSMAEHISTPGTWVQACLQVYSKRTRITDSFRFLIVEDANDHKLTVGAFLISHDRP